MHYSSSPHKHVFYLIQLVTVCSWPPLVKYRNVPLVNLFSRIWARILQKRVKFPLQWKTEFEDLHTQGCIKCEKRRILWGCIFELKALFHRVPLLDTNLIYNRNLWCSLYIISSIWSTVFPKVNRSWMNIQSNKGVQITGPSIKFIGHSHTPQRRCSDSYWSLDPVMNNLLLD